MLLFDKNYIFVDAAYRQLSGDAKQVGTAVKAPHDYLVREVTVTEPGYAFIFLSNENLTEVDVHFDDVKITHTHSNIVAGADYYPYGLVMDGREIEDEPYRWGYQGQFSEKDLTTGMQEFELRMYDARIGRWISPDPYGEFASPYISMGNVPQMFTDPDGGCVTCNSVWNEALQAWIINEAVVFASSSIAGSVLTSIGTGLSSAANVFTDHNPGGDFLYQVNKFNPIAIVANSASAYYSGKDTYGNEQSVSEATTNLAMVIPIGRVAGAGAKLAEKGLSLAAKVERRED